MSKVVSINSEDAFDKLLKIRNQVIVIDFSAKWCGPCKKIAPYYEKLAVSVPDIIFAKIDVDEFEEISKSAGIKSIPSFIFYKNGKEIMRVSGADLNAVLKACKDCQNL